MPKYNKKVVYHYHNKYYESGRKVFQQAEQESKKEGANWLKEKNHVNWDHLRNIREKIAKAEHRLQIERDSRHLFEIEHLHQIKEALLYEGKNLQPLNDHQIKQVYQPKPQGKTTLITKKQGQQEVEELSSESDEENNG